MVGRLDDLTLECLLGVLAGALDGDVDAVIDGLERLGLAVRPPERMRLRQDVAHLIELLSTSRSRPFRWQR